MVLTGTRTQQITAWEGNYAGSLPALSLTQTSSSPQPEQACADSLSGQQMDGDRQFLSGPLKSNSSRDMNR